MTAPTTGSTHAIYDITKDISQGSHWALAQQLGSHLDEQLGAFDVVIIGCFERDLLYNYCPATTCVLHVPFDDNADGVSDSTWEHLFHLTHYVIAKGARALTICTMGENRSGLLSALLLHARYGFDGQHCIDLIRQKAAPRSGQPYTLWNPGFVRQIVERLT